MILEIFSSYGRLEAIPMTLQAIETSILGESDEETNQDSEVVRASCAESFSCHESEIKTQVSDDEIQE